MHVRNAIDESAICHLLEVQILPSFSLNYWASKDRERLIEWDDLSEAHPKEKEGVFHS